ncbi:tipE homolog 1 phospholipid transfer protein isoform X3 [Lasioglossum baleicum]|uniref:tipE homolog 1 phospholipid transfer protein isoform X3 n=1 Tax=Lasioglossum baleicum TaxID=434251 RepID=UPI003FCCF2F2
MRGSSSELLLEASCVQCQSDHPSQHRHQQDDEKHDFQTRELRRRKLLEFGFGASRRRPPRRTCRQRFNFYATSALAFVATSGGAALLFLVPLYVDPAISTLAADFSPEPVICTTSRREELYGLFNCTWSSCREGCTSDVYRCTHIYVTYTPWSNDTMKNDTGGKGNSSSIGVVPTSTTTAVPTPGDVEAALLVNIKGCGYPPVVDCDNFTRELGYEGAKFPCHYSRVNGSIVMANYDREAQVTTIIHFFAAPFVVTLATSVALCVMHCDCRCSPPPRHSSRGLRRARGNDLSYFHRHCQNHETCDRALLVSHWYITLFKVVIRSSNKYGVTYAPKLLSIVRFSKCVLHRYTKNQVFGKTLIPNQISIYTKIR